jgi:hypothetical protein
MSKSALSAALASPAQQPAARPAGKQDESSFPCLTKGQGGPSDPTENGDFSEAAAMRRSGDIAGSAPTAILSSSGAPYVSVGSRPACTHRDNPRRTASSLLCSCGFVWSSTP